MSLTQTVKVPQQRASSTSEGEHIVGTITVNDHTCGKTEPAVVHRHLDPRFVLPGQCQGKIVELISEAGSLTRFYHLVAVSPQHLIPDAITMLPAEGTYVLNLVFNHLTGALSWKVVRHVA